jgi:hypothetical protein
MATEIYFLLVRRSDDLLAGAGDAYAAAPHQKDWRSIQHVKVCVEGVTDLFGARYCSGAFVTLATEQLIK